MSEVLVVTAACALPGEVDDEAGLLLCSRLLFNRTAMTPAENMRVPVDEVEGARAEPSPAPEVEVLVATGQERER